MPLISMFYSEILGCRTVAHFRINFSAFFIITLTFYQNLYQTISSTTGFLLNIIIGF